jgi:hypothetical protein
MNGRIVLLSMLLIGLIGVVVVREDVAHLFVDEKSSSGSMALEETPDAAALFEAFESGDSDAIETQAAAVSKYFDDGGDSIRTVRVAASAPDLIAIATGIHSTDAEDRTEAMQALGRNNPYQGGEETAVLIRVGLVDAANEVRLASADTAAIVASEFSLARMGGSSLEWDWESDMLSRSALLSAIIDTSSDAVSQRAARAMIRIYSPSSDIQDALVNRYVETGTRELRETIVLSLGQHAYQSIATHDLIGLARQAAEVEVRSAAALATAQCGVADAMAILQAMLEAETDESAQSTIEMAIRLLE